MYLKRVRLSSFIAINEIFLLILAVVAVSFLVGQSNLVSAGPVFTGGSQDAYNAFYNAPATTAAGNPIATEAIPELQPEIIAGEDPLTAAINNRAAEEAAKNAGDSAGGKGIEGLFSDVYEGNTFGGGVPGHLVSGLLFAAVAGGVTYMIVGALGGSDNAAKSAGIAVAVGAGIARFGFLQATASGEGSVFTSLFHEVGFGAYSGGGAFLWGIAIAAVVFVLTYKEEKQKVVNLECMPWEAPLGGADCEKCNQDPLRPCSEYRCKSLGQACEIVNSGSKEERCVWVSRNDVSSPKMFPLESALSVDHKYTDLQGRPPSRGTKIVRNDQDCIKPFTPLQFGLATDEPSQCKIDYDGNRTFEQMQFYFGESNFYSYNHTEKLRLPSPDSMKAESPQLPQAGIYDFHVRCQDANGNVNVDDFVFEFCVDDSPDTTAPIIESTSIIPGSPVQFGAQSVPLAIFVNEPAECKWSPQDKDYDLMENTMSCSTKVSQQNAQQLYPCVGNLTGVKDTAENTYYIRCKDQPSKVENERNVNTQSYVFKILGSQALTITSAGPNGTITGNTNVVPVDLSIRTDNGAQEGKSVCLFSPNGNQSSYVTMFETNSFQHKQTLSLAAGNYKYYFRCIDAGGNAAESSTSFTVNVDKLAPFVTRAYKEEPDALKIITNEDAQCVYSLKSCNYNFVEGIAMKETTGDKRTFAAEWKGGQKYYVKCKDGYDNQPAPNACTIIVGASSFG